jgi:cytosine/adenosine deaminase-related metal-dependent hydrolase
MAHRVGSLEIGKQADVIAVAAERVTAADPVGALLESVRGEDVLLVLIDGAVRHSRCEVPACA